MEAVLLASRRGNKSCFTTRNGWKHHHPRSFQTPHGSLQSYNTNNDTNISSINSSISSLQSFQTSQGLLNSNISGDLIDVNNLVNTKQNIINNSNKLPIANINLSGSSLTYCTCSALAAGQSEELQMAGIQRADPSTHRQLLL